MIDPTWEVNDELKELGFAGDPSGIARVANNTDNLVLTMMKECMDKINEQTRAKDDLLQHLKLALTKIDSLEKELKEIKKISMNNEVKLNKAIGIGNVATQYTSRGDTAERTKLAFPLMLLSFIVNYLDTFKMCYDSADVGPETHEFLLKFCTKVFANKKEVDRTASDKSNYPNWGRFLGHFQGENSIDYLKKNVITFANVQSWCKDDDNLNKALNAAMNDIISIHYCWFSCETMNALNQFESFVGGAFAFKKRVGGKPIRHKEDGNYQPRIVLQSDRFNISSPNIKLVLQRTNWRANPRNYLAKMKDMTKGVATGDKVHNPSINVLDKLLANNEDSDEDYNPTNGSMTEQSKDEQELFSTINQKKSAKLIPGMRF